ncbi:molecular chaperone SurA [Alkalilimnicola ehrlichii]|uniref:Chaperone SurA n=1 Tax=Alkalilimnicola ehrlichii TaxID=351052 RepID=A0A3E0X3N0_9GAMM|nr:peptidylprolyl isomerase [Alkalilimnicola ehrlichii]RFA31274.1 molecular chaperone SurA [Alkalilimnicola ehrlichii]RFA39452.1 molecular chaperone SurA [Alkalilimnicola ehrlichii]
MSISLRRRLTQWTAGLLLACIGTAVSAGETLDRIVAVVNDDVVLASELEQEMQQIAAQLQAQGARLPPIQVLREQVLERLIIQRLQLSVAERMGIQVDEATLNSAVRRIAQQNNMTLSQFRDVLEQDGISYAQFREAVRDEIAVTRLRQAQLERQIQITPQEIDEYLETRAARDDSTEYLVSHILIATPEAASAEQIREARAEAEQVLAELREGADFAAMAASHSDSRTALEGGDLGWRSEGELPTLFAAVVPAMETGEVSDIIENAGGFHIVKLQQRRTGDAEMVTQTRARHILIRTTELVGDDDAQARIESLHRRIEGGANFAELARSHSDDPGSAARGGDLGWADPGTMVPEFENVMNSLAPGELSEPFRTPFGWHIVEVLDRREQDVSEDIRRAQAAEQLRARKMEEATENWLRQMRDEAYVEIRLD